MSLLSGSWPALRGTTTPVEAFQLRCGRGLRGKAHGAASDFRWIARSPAFGAGRSGLADELLLGSEDLPVKAFAWRAVQSRWYAIHAYPSRAVDAFGRTGFVEKQILEWTGESEVPVAVAALLMLTQVGRLSDDDWWHRREMEEWKNDRYSLSLEDAEIQDSSFSI
jgi:hypothetical protein